MKNDSSLLFLENQLCFPLYAASRLTTKIYAPYLKELDITYPQYLVMLVLWEHEELSVKSIGERLYLESNTLTPLLKRLEQKQLVHRVRSKTDERTVHISLSKKGQALKAEAILIPQKLIGSFQDQSIDESELKSFHSTLFKLVGILGEQVNGKEVS